MKLKSGLKNKSISLALSMAIGIFTPTVAHAEFLTVAAITSLFTLVQEFFNGTKKGFSGIVKSMEASTKAIIESQSEQADAVYAKEGDRKVAELQLQAVQNYQLAPAPCLTIGAATAAKYALNASQAATSKVQREITDRQLTTRNTGDSGLLRNFSQSQPYMKGGDRAADFLDADILASSLLLGAGKPGKAKDETLDANVTTKLQEEAARAFVNNAISSQPLPNLPDRQATTDEGRKYIAMQRAEAAQISIPQYSFANALAQTLKVTGLGTAMGSQWKSLNMPADISPNQFLSTEVNRRFANPGWHTDMSGGSPASVAKEGVYVAALNVKLQHQRLEALGRIELLLAQNAINSTLSSESHRNALTQYSRASAITTR